MLAAEEEEAEFGDAVNSVATAAPEVVAIAAVVVDEGDLCCGDG